MHKKPVTDTGPPRFTWPWTLHVVLSQVSCATCISYRPGPSPGAWAPTAFLSRALWVSLALGNAAKSGSGDTTSAKGPINGINVKRHWRLSQAVAVPRDTYKDIFLMFCCPEWRLQGNGTKVGKEEFLITSHSWAALQGPPEREINLKMSGSSLELRLLWGSPRYKRESSGHPLTITFSQCQCRGSCSDCRGFSSKTRAADRCWEFDFSSSVPQPNVCNVPGFVFLVSLKIMWNHIVLPSLRE